MRRREFIGLTGAAAAAWPMAARAQFSPRQIGILVPGAEGDPESRAFVTAFEQGLAETGWRIGGDVRVEYRWAVDGADKTKAVIAEAIFIGALATGAAKRLYARLGFSPLLISREWVKG